MAIIKLTLNSVYKDDKYAFINFSCDSRVDSEIRYFVIWLTSRHGNPDVNFTCHDHYTVLNEREMRILLRENSCIACSKETLDHEMHTLYSRGEWR